MSIPYEKPRILERPKPCRKCGSYAYALQLSTLPDYKIWTVVCSNEQCDLSTAEYYGTKADAIAA